MTEATTPEAILAGLCVQGMRADELLAKEGLVLTQGGSDLPAGGYRRAGMESRGARGGEAPPCLGTRADVHAGAVILRSNGKHYLGELIPRWKLTLLSSPRENAGATLDLRACRDPDPLPGLSQP
jgi:hypothetical protein